MFNLEWDLRNFGSEKSNFFNVYYFWTSMLILFFTVYIIYLFLSFFNYNNILFLITFKISYLLFSLSVLLRSLSNTPKLVFIICTSFSLTYFSNSSLDNKSSASIFSSTFTFSSSWLWFYRPFNINSLNNFSYLYTSFLANFIASRSSIFIIARIRISSPLGNILI